MVANVQYKIMQKTWKIIETLAYGYSSESTWWELSYECQHDRVSDVFQKYLHPCSLDESSLSIGRVNPYAAGGLIRPIQNDAKNLKKKKWLKLWNNWVLMWEYSVRAIQWIPTCQGLELEGLTY